MRKKNKWDFAKRNIAVNAALVGLATDVFPTNPACVYVSLDCATVIKGGK